MSDDNRRPNFSCYYSSFAYNPRVGSPRKQIIKVGRSIQHVLQHDAKNHFSG